jgi:ABC-type proline/glycine betaine transport system substrate-binding protein
MLTKFRLAIIAAALSFSAGSPAADCGAVSITEMNWT